MKSRANTHVELVAYDPRWVNRFTAAAAQIRAVLPSAVIEHIGSTSVPGLSSKDTIDVLVGVLDVAAALTLEVVEEFAVSGFEHVASSFSEDPDHAFFHRIVDEHRTEHVHVMRIGSDTYDGHLLFRDFLRARSDAAWRYEAAKRDLAVRFAERRDDYVTQKQVVVERLMGQARAWQLSGG